VRAFVECITVAGSKRSGEIRLRKLPALEALGNRSVESLAGVRCDGQSIKGVGLRVVPLRFASRGNALVPRLVRSYEAVPRLKVVVGA